MDTTKLIDELEEIIFVSDLTTYELLYTNDYARQVMGLEDAKTDKKCYEIIHGYDAPCPFCTNPLLRYGEFYVWEHYNPKIKRHFILKDKLIDWNGQPARMEIAVDITEKECVSRQVENMLKTERAIVKCIRALIAAKSLDDALDAVLTGIGGHYQADRVFILEMDPTMQMGSNTYEWCAPGVPSVKEYLQDTPLSALPYWKQAIQNKQFVVIRDVEEYKDQYPNEYSSMHFQGIHMLIAAPFMVEEQGLGYLGIVNPAYNEDDPSLLQALSYFVVCEMVKRRTQDQLEFSSSHDALTGLLNRTQYLRDLNSSGREQLDSVGVVFCDINGLKQINDSGGHIKGDQAIIHTAKVLQDSFASRCARCPCKVYRLSGDEFIVICKGIGKETFQAMAEKAKALLQYGESVSVSIGWVWEDKGIDVRRLAHEADERMYLEKQEYYRKNPDSTRR